MFHDHQAYHYFSQQQNFGRIGPTGAAFTASSNVVDLQANRDISEGQNCYVRIQVTETFVIGGGGPRLLIGVGYADNAALTLNPRIPLMACGGPSVFLGGAAFIATPGGYLAGGLDEGLLAGKELLIPIPPHQYALQRWMGMLYIEPSWLTSYFSAGRLTAHIVHNPPQRTIYPDGIS